MPRAIYQKIEAGILSHDPYGKSIGFTTPNGRDKYGTWCGCCVTTVINLVILIFAMHRLQTVVEYGDT